MHPLRTPSRMFKLALFLALSNPQHAHGNKNRKDLCGLSIHASDFPDIGNFSVIDGTWTVPEVVQCEGCDTTSQAHWVSNGVALCCGDDCSTRLSANMLAKVRNASEPESTAIGELAFQLSPLFDSIKIPDVHNFYLNSSNTIWTRIEILSPHLAQLTFSAFEGPSSNLTVSVDIGTGVDKSGALLSVATRGNGAEAHEIFRPRRASAELPVLCGDSAWWFLSDQYGPGENTERPKRLARFSPVLVGGHGLQTTKKQWFPADLALSGVARFWNMVRDTGGRTEELCHAKDFVDSGMVMLHAPHSWGV